MLVLSRRTGESLVIGDDVVVTVLEVKGDGGVRLGIDAPRSTRVHRAEVYAAVKAANADASRAGNDPSGEQVEQLLKLAGRRPDGAGGAGAGARPDRPAGQAQDGSAPTGH
ncbi:carbon storage regulator CsrA [Aquipuribacter sp. MA13-6]|uniref:carbon storage regulator CsrA n=1 Tax=unclassified Aquipuribacter TaxID=2635084 RepID=UPI003EEDAC17